MNLALKPFKIKRAAPFTCEENSWLLSVRSSCLVFFLIPGGMQMLGGKVSADAEQGR